MERATSGLHVFVYMVLISFLLATFDAVAPSYLILIIMKNVEFLKYDAPEVEIIEVEVEKGFAGSGNMEDPESGGSI